MKTDTPRPILLKNYRPPSYLINSVNLDVALHKTRTRVRSRLKLRANPSVAKPGPLRLDGELLELESIRLNGHQLTKHDGYTLGEKELIVPRLPGTPSSSTPSPSATRTPTRRSGTLRSKGIYCTQCEARASAASPISSTARTCWRPTRCASRRTASEAPVLLANGNPVERGTLRRRPPLRDVARPASQALLPVRARRRRPRVHRLRLHAPFRPQGRPRASTWSTARRSAPPGRWIALKRSMRWDEQRFGREYDLDVFNIVAVSDFNMGAMENKGLNIFNDRLMLASPRDRDRRRFRSDRERRRARVFPQLDRQPHHLPRLVPALPQGGPDGLPRPGVLGATSARAPVQRIADVRRLRAHQFPEDAGPLAHPVRPETLHRDQQLLYGDRLREGRRGRAHAADAARAPMASARAWTFISSATTARRRRSRSSSPASRTPRARPHPVRAGTRRRARRSWCAA